MRVSIFLSVFDVHVNRSPASGVIREVRYQPGATRQEIDGSQGDLAFIDGGTSSGLAAGETYMLDVPENLIPHPVTKEIIGRD